MPASHVLALGQSPLQLDQYRISIKPPVFTVLVLSLSYRLLTTDSQNHNYDYTTTTQLETALVNRFCNTELRTATVIKIKGLSIQTQLNMFVLFTLLN